MELQTQQVVSLFVWHMYVLRDIYFYISDKSWLLVQSPIPPPQSGEKHPGSSWSFGCRRLCVCSDAFAIDFLNFQCNAGLVFLHTWESALEREHLCVQQDLDLQTDPAHPFALIEAHKHTQAENNTFTPLRSQPQQGFNAWTALL